jgi:hypothetical protein
LESADARAFTIGADPNYSPIAKVSDVDVSIRSDGNAVWRAEAGSVASDSIAGD